MSASQLTRVSSHFHQHEASDLLKRMLTFNPDRRITVSAGFYNFCYKKS